MSTRFVARQDNGNWYDFWYWEDNGYVNEPEFWTNLLIGVTTVVAQVATAEVLADDTVHPPIKYQPQGPWQTFEIAVLPDGHCRAVVGGMAKDREWVVRVILDGTPYPQFSVRVM